MVRWPGAAPGSSRSQRDALLLSYAPDKWSFRPVPPRRHPRYKGGVLLLNYGSEKNGHAAQVARRRKIPPVAALIDRMKWRSVGGMLPALAFTKGVRR